MRRWTSLSVFIALAIVLVLGPPLHRAVGDAAYVLDVLLFGFSFLLVRWFLHRLGD